jgi:acyl-coenzyme A synthetase/AMP-(fatty) acid ligase
LPLSKLLSVGRPDDHPVAVTSSGEPVSFSRFRSDVAHNAARLRLRGARSGTPVCEDSYWFLVGLLALLHAGAAAAVPHSTRPRALEELTSDSDCRVVDRPATSAAEFALEPGPGRPAPLEPFDPSSSIADFFTSGSTGRPKRVRKTVLGLEREAEAIDTRLGAAAAMALASATVSHQHIYALSFKLIWPVCSGRPFSGATHAHWESALAEIAPGGVLVTSPAHLTRLVGIDPLPADRRPSVVISAGAPLPAEAARMAATVFGTPVSEMFGSTETGAFAGRPSAGGDEPWQPFAGVDVGQTDDGRLRVRGPHIADDLWFETADLVDLLPEGRFRFRGRSDRIVKIEAKRVSLPEVEQRLAALPWVAAARVAMVGEAPQRLGAAVVLSAEGASKHASLGGFRFGRLLRRSLAETLDPAGLPRLWRFVERLPEGQLGKVRTDEIAALFSETGKA